MYTLGINAAFHDSAACLVHDGRVLAAAEEERFIRIKHGKRPIPFSAYELPFHAIDYCLAEAGIRLADVDHVAYSFNPYILLGAHRGDVTITLPLEPSAQAAPEEWEAPWDPLFLASIVNAPRHLAGGYPHHLQDRLRGVRFDGPFQWHFVEHHLAHAASAFLPSPVERAAVWTLDGRGERATTTYHVGESDDLVRIGQVNMPHSLGVLYEDVTRHLGFLHSSDEYKVMALASYGRPRYLDQFREIIRVGDDGQYTIGPLRLEERFGPPRLRGAEFRQRDYDLACSLQVALEEAVLRLADWLHEAAGCDTLCLAGGVALNCVMNARLRDESPFREVWAQPAAGDAGTALGAALWIDAQRRGAGSRSFRMDHAYWGPAYGDDQIEAFLRWSKVPYRRSNDVAEETAEILAADKIIGWFQGRMEFGPRALGARSILASPIHPDMQARLNEIKDREDFRPVAPVVLEEEAARWFRTSRPEEEDNGAVWHSTSTGTTATVIGRASQPVHEAASVLEPSSAMVSPFMLFVHDVLPQRADQIPAVRHVDGTARIQTVNREQNPVYHDLLKAFQRRTGVPVLVNTSFNTRGEPIVCTPRDAVECFWTSPLDALVIGSFLLEKKGPVA